MIKRLFLLAALTGVWSVSAQNGTLHLRLVDRVTREPVVGAVAELRSQADTARTPFYAASDIDGVALLQRVPAGAWRLRVTSLGYEALERELRTSGGKTDLGTLEMSPGAEAIESVVLEVPALRSSIRGDTLSYRASAYKVTFGADAGALIGKMPGLEVADGVIEAQGRTVQRVFVDGREFFGNDVMSAVRNIPADMVESIDVYNSQGDQSEFTGVDIGDGYTAINIVTQPDKRRGAFGRLFAGYGIPDKYIGGGNVNIFDRARRLSVIALVNNVNMQNFSSEDILGTTEQGQANARSGSGNFMVRPLDGVSTVQAVGANYSDEWGEKAKITASYFFNRAGNRNESLTDRQTFTSSEKLVLYDGATDARIENVNHRFNSRFDYKFNNRHSLMMRTAFSVQDYLLDNETFSRTDNKFALRKPPPQLRAQRQFRVQRLQQPDLPLPVAGQQAAQPDFRRRRPIQRRGAVQPAAAVYLPRSGQHRGRYGCLRRPQYFAYAPRTARLLRQRKRDLHPCVRPAFAHERRLPRDLRRQPGEPPNGAFRQ